MSDKKLVSLYEFQKELMAGSDFSEPHEQLSTRDWLKVWGWSFYDSYNQWLCHVLFMILPLLAMLPVVAACAFIWKWLESEYGVLSVLSLIWAALSIWLYLWLFRWVYRFYDANKYEDRSPGYEALLRISRAPAITSQTIKLFELFSSKELKAYFDPYGNRRYVEAPDNEINPEFWRRNRANVLMFRGRRFFIGHPDVDMKKPDRVFFRRDLLEKLLSSGKDQGDDVPVTTDLLSLPGANDVFDSVNSYTHENKHQGPKNKVIRGFIRTQNLDSLEKFLKACFDCKLVNDDARTRLSLATILALAAYRKEHGIVQSDTTNLANVFSKDVAALEPNKSPDSEIPEYFWRFLAVYAEHNPAKKSFGSNKAERAAIGRRAVGATTCDYDIFKTLASHFVHWLSEEERKETA